MSLVAGDVKLLPPFQPIQMAQGMATVDAFRIYFSIRNEGRYHIDLPQAGFSVQGLMEAIQKVAEPIVEALDLYK